MKAGPFRLNLSKSGIGVSAGVPGFRAGVGPRGTYVRMGRGGVYYHKTISGSQREHVRPINVAPSVDVIEETAKPVTVLALDVAAPSTLTEQLNEAARHSWLALISWARGKRSTPVIYDLDDNAAAVFGSVVAAFEAVQRCAGAWMVPQEQPLQRYYSRKVNAGAGSLVKRLPLKFSVEPAKPLTTNIAVPSLSTTAFSVHVLPDQLVVRQGKRWAAWPYSDVHVSIRPIRFIEGGSVPSDCRQVDTTWKYVNRSGGPDRRFKNNRQLPVLEYAEMDLTTPGLRVRWQFSNVPAGNAFAQAIGSLRSLPQSTAA